MDLAEYCVTAVLVERRSIREVAAATGRSKSWVHGHVHLYKTGGAEALKPHKRGRKTAPNQTPATLEDEIVRWRKQLTGHGYDAGAATCCDDRWLRKQPSVVCSMPPSSACAW